MTKNSADPLREIGLRMSLSFPQVDTVNRIERMLRLKRIGAGKYQTPDGKFDIWKDPLSGDMGHSTGFISWLIFAKGDNEPLHLSGSPHCPTLKDARGLLEAYIAKARATA